MGLRWKVEHPADQHIRRENLGLAAPLETSCKHVTACRWGTSDSPANISSYLGESSLLQMSTLALWFQHPEQCFKPLEFTSGEHLFSEGGWRGSQVSLLARNTPEYLANSTPGVYQAHSHFIWPQWLCTSLFLGWISNKKIDVVSVVYPHLVFFP